MSLYEFVKEWQSLIGSVLALIAAIIAAFVGAHFVRLQTRLADEQETERKRARFAAARGVLPFTLSALTDYARACGALLRVIHSGPRQGTSIVGPIANIPPLPHLPQNSIADLRELIAAGDARIGNLVSGILTEVQVQHVRLAQLHADMADTTTQNTEAVANVEVFITDAVWVYMKSSALFDFARRETEDLPKELTAGDATNGLNQMRFYGEQYDQLRAFAGRRARREAGLPAAAPGTAGAADEVAG